MAGEIELGAGVPAHGDDVGRLTPSYRSSATSVVTPEREGAAMVGCKVEVASTPARCSIEGLPAWAR